MIKIDNFLEQYSSLKDFADNKATFADVENPVDGVSYPLICTEIPESIKSEIVDQLSMFMHRLIENPTIFIRMSPAGVHCPHVFHNDISMGNFSFMLYMDNRPNDAGTGLFMHAGTGGRFPTPETIEEESRDINNPDAWIQYDMAESYENRGALFDANLYHAALPFGGYGKTQAESRKVLTCFFS